MMKIVAVFCLVAAIAAVPTQVEEQRENYYWFEFGKFVNTHTKEYLNAGDFHNAFANFKANLERINAHNAESSSFKLALNQFSDLSYAEFVKSHTGYRASAARVAAPQTHLAVSDVPKEKDWRKDATVVGPIKDQGSCGSCWAFSAVVSLEGAHGLKYKKYVSLSEQQLVDCSTSFGNMGCNGGLMDNAFTYLINATKGDDTEKAYPYTAADGKCAYKEGAVGGSITSFVDIKANDEAALMNAVGTAGPVSVAIDASDDFMFYSGGIFDSTSCSSDPQQLNHGVAIVGYGTENGKDYWIVRNSWGTSWGEKGYVRMARGKNMCGIADAASYPIA